MKWHTHLMAWKAFAEGRSFEDFMRLFDSGTKRMPSPTAAGKVGVINSRAQLLGERRWEMAKRPYYDVYPSVVEAFAKVDLEKIMCEHIRLPLDDLLIRFQEGHELAGGGSLAHTILASQTHSRDGTRGIIVSVNDGTEIGHHPATAIVLRAGSTIESRLAIGRDNEHRVPGSQIDDGLIGSVFRLVVSLCLLKDNPDLIEPEPIEADRAKWEATHDPALLEKAARRGLRRWSVGKHIEVAPGFRRPHFAIRWCGKGGEDPRLRPIKGCLVRRQQVTEIPTGYLDHAEAQ